MTIVPVIIIFTKFDLFVQALGNEGSQNGKISREMAEREFRKRYSQIFEASTKGTVSQTPYTLVARSFSPLALLSSALISSCSISA